MPPSTTAPTTRSRRSSESAIPAASFARRQSSSRSKPIRESLPRFNSLGDRLASAEARRNNALREIDRHREAFGGALRHAIDEVEDVEFRDVETGETNR